MKDASSENCELHLEKNPSTIRPLLALNRFDISKLCIYWQLPVYPDQSNQKMSFLRNRVRKQLLPTIKLFFNSRIENILLQFSEIFADEDHYMNQITEKLFSKLGSANTLAHSPFSTCYYDKTLLPINPPQGLPSALSNPSFIFEKMCYIGDVTQVAQQCCKKASAPEVQRQIEQHNLCEQIHNMNVNQICLCTSGAQAPPTFAPKVHMLAKLNDKENVLLSTLNKSFNWHRNIESISKRKIIITSLASSMSAIKGDAIVHSKRESSNQHLSYKEDLTAQHVQDCQSIRCTPTLCYNLSVSRQKYSETRDQIEDLKEQTTVEAPALALYFMRSKPIVLRCCVPKWINKVNEQHTEGEFVTKITTDCAFVFAPSVHCPARRLPSVTLPLVDVLLDLRCYYKKIVHLFCISNSSKDTQSIQCTTHNAQCKGAKVQRRIVHCKRQEMERFLFLSLRKCNSIINDGTFDKVSAPINVRDNCSNSPGEWPRVKEATIHWALSSQLELSARIAIGRFFAPLVIDQKWKICFLRGSAWQTDKLYILDRRITLKSKQKKKDTNKLVTIFSKFDQLEREKKEIYWPILISFLPKAIQRRFVKLFLVNQNLKQVRYSQIEQFLRIIKKL